RVDGRLLRPGDVLRLRRGSGAVATAVFAAAFRAGLADLTADLPVVLDPDGGNGVPAGQRFRNDGTAGVLVDVSTTPARRGARGAVRVRLWSTKTWNVSIHRGARSRAVTPPIRIGRGAGCRPSAGVPGYTVTITRVYRLPGESTIDHSETFRSVTAPVDRVVCR
ncbi:MAG TPA: hypothetical protein VN088_11870, partial [Nocardioides sp.]|nr:hypothetical protein [Nocardioides sp.]